tara:strand:- start:608 stop:1564 length:957 start_codon:yes stop_codon:yes gene_type:complete
MTTDERDDTGEALTVGDDDAGARVDVFLVRRVEHMSRAKARALTAEGKVRVDGRRVKKGHRVSPGETVRLEELPAPTDFEPVADPDLELTIVHEDDHLVVVDKAAGLPCHPLRPDETGTVVNALVARYPEMRGVGRAVREAGLLHRLDNDTSGLLMAARTAVGFTHYATELTERRVDKRYLALTSGFVHAPAFIDWPIAHDRADRRRMVVCERPEDADRMGARPASTEVLAAELVGSGGFSRVEVRAKSARRHQVRAHLAALGHPLVGDELYGGANLPGLTRHFLHASRIVVGSLDGERLDLRSDLGPDLRAALAQLT